MIILSELDEPIWAIITFKDVICTDKTYTECEEIYIAKKLNPNHATIVTNDVAERTKASLIRHIEERAELKEV